MLHVFSINRVKLLARTPTATDIKGRREYLVIFYICSREVVPWRACVLLLVSFASKALFVHSVA
jgi:hypothetical protein